MESWYLHWLNRFVSVSFGRQRCPKKRLGEEKERDIITSKGKRQNLLFGFVPVCLYIQTFLPSICLRSCREFSFASIRWRSVFLSVRFAPVCLFVCPFAASAVCWFCRFLFSQSVCVSAEPSAFYLCRLAYVTILVSVRITSVCASPTGLFLPPPGIYLPSCQSIGLCTCLSRFQ